jgi:hypothetical protein
MMEHKFADTYIHQVGRFCYVAHNPATVIVGVGESRDEAMRVFKSNWGNRGEITWIDGPPPPPKREGEKPPIESALEQAEELRRGYSVYRELVRRYHPDTADEKEVPTGQVVADIIRLWQACK